MKTFDVSYNQTHRGHYLKPDSFSLNCTTEMVEEKLFRLIDFQDRLCRIWINDVCVWYYNNPRTISMSTHAVVDEIMESLNQGPL